MGRNYIKDLPLDTRSKNILRYMFYEFDEIEVVGFLAVVSTEELLAEPNFGKKSLVALYEAVSKVEPEAAESWWWPRKDKPLHMSKRVRAHVETLQAELAEVKAELAEARIALATK